MNFLNLDEENPPLDVYTRTAQSVSQNPDGKPMLASAFDDHRPARDETKIQRTWSRRRREMEPTIELTFGRTGKSFRIRRQHHHVSKT